MTLRTDNVPTDMSLTDGIVTLRPWQPADAEAIFAAIEESRPELQQWLPAAGGVTHVNEVRQYIAMTLEWRETRVAYDFVIADAQTGGVLGGCGLTQINRNHHFANLYYWVRCGSARRGVARRAIRLAARFGMEAVGLARVEIVGQPENTASLRAAESAGAVREGVLRNRLTVHDTPGDAVMFSLIPADFGSRRT